MAGPGRDAHRPRERLRCRPTPDQELLLHACLLKGAAAVRAFDLWRARTDIDRLDHGSYRLLPLLYANLRDLGSKDPLTEKLKGVYRRTWYTNQLLFHRAAALIQALEEAGLETLLFKGGALIPLHYKDLGLRPMGDFDVLVPTERATEAATVLQRNGWRPRLLFETQRLSRDCAGFVSGSGQEVDLHWHLLEECCYEGADQPFWDNAVPLSLNGIPTRALGAADHLFYVCVHGSRWKDVPPVRWVPDALAILGGRPGRDAIHLPAGCLWGPHPQRGAGDPGEGIGGPLRPGRPRHPLQAPAPPRLLHRDLALLRPGQARDGRPAAGPRFPSAPPEPLVPGALLADARVSDR